MTRKGARGPTQERLDLAARVRWMKNKGALHSEIGKELGLSRSYVSELLLDPDGSKARIRKDSYSGTCIDCGSPTSGSDGRNKVPTRCADCRIIYEKQFPRIYWTKEKVVKAIQWWAETYGEQPSIPDFNPLICSKILGDWPRHDRGRKNIEAGLTPSVNIVYHRFGSWNAAIEAAGFTPRSPDGGGGNHTLHRRWRAK